MSEKVNFTFLYPIMHIIIPFIIYWSQIVIICTRNNSQHVLIGLFPKRKMKFLVGHEGQQPVTKLSQCPKRPVSWTRHMEDRQRHTDRTFNFFWARYNFFGDVLSRGRFYLETFSLTLGSTKNHVYTIMSLR